MHDKYKYIGFVYDFLSNLYSGKNIYRCKIAMLDIETVKLGDRILFAGVGHGRDVIRAVELGDILPPMEVLDLWDYPA